MTSIAIWHVDSIFDSQISELRQKVVICTRVGGILPHTCDGGIDEMTVQGGAFRVSNVADLLHMAEEGTLPMASLPCSLLYWLPWESRDSLC